MEYFTDDQPIKNAGFYHKERKFKDRNHVYTRDDNAYYTPQTCHIPEGAVLLSVFATTEVELGENVIVFYWIGEPRNIVGVRRIRVSAQEPTLYIYSVAYVENLAKYLQSDPIRAVPDIFDTLYGRVFSQPKYVDMAQAGFNRVVKRVFQFEDDGRRTIPVDSNLVYRNQPFIVEFHNGEYLLGFSNFDYDDRHIPRVDRRITAEVDGNKSTLVSGSRAKAEDLVKAWEIGELGIYPEIVKTPEPPVVVQEPIKRTWKTRLKEWWNKQ